MAKDKNLQGFRNLEGFSGEICLFNKCRILSL
jgi:hypothetical protein